MSLPTVLPASPSTAEAPRPRTDLAPHLPQLRAALDQQRAFRIGQIAELTELIRRQRGAQVGVQMRVLLALRRGAVSALADIDTALRLMDVDEYGRCRVCGTALPLSRLEVLPAAPLCMECQRQHETAEA